MKFGGIIRGWYEKNKRDLPWRRTGDPYKIWLSEVILQQTRVNQGLDYYLEFLKRFPDLASLAHADEDEVLKKWQGLGYYSRARNLHRAAREVMGQMGGKIPRTYEGLLGLKGVGPYTAAAISSICFGEARAVVDGNVSRVIARLHGLEDPVNSTGGKRAIHALARELLDRADPGGHNQAMMEFGALQCVPVSPDCSVCPAAVCCEAHRSGRVNLIPVRTPARKPVDRWIIFYVILYKGETILTKRGTGGIWKSLYQFPAEEWDRPVSAEEAAGSGLSRFLNGAGQEKVAVTRISDPIKHQLTHRTLHATFIHVQPGSWPLKLPEGWIRIPVERLDDYPVPRLINRYMEVVKF